MDRYVGNVITHEGLGGYVWNVKTHEGLGWNDGSVKLWSHPGKFGHFSRHWRLNIANGD